MFLFAFCSLFILKLYITLGELLFSVIYNVLQNFVSAISEHVIAPETNATLRALLDNSFGATKRNARSLRKYRSVSGQNVRPGYSSDSQFACRHCGKRYRWKSTMRRHEQVECGGKEPMFQCPRCPYRAKQKGNLGVHLRKHHNLTGFVKIGLAQKNR